MDENVEQEIKVTPSKQLQAKLTASLGDKTSEHLVSQIRDAFKLGDFVIEPTTTEVLDDEYFDTEDLALHSCQASVRFRRNGNTICLTIKKMRAHEPGQLDRDELTENLSEATAQELLERGFRRVLREHFADLGDRATLKPIARIRNNRQNFSLSRRTEKYEMSVDQFRCESPQSGHPGPQYFEIEIEALNDEARDHLPSIKRNLRNAVDLHYSDLSKYERAIAEVVKRPVTLSAPGLSAPPDTFASGFMREVWGLKPSVRRFLLLTVVLIGALFAAWSSLPDSVKERLLGGSPVPPKQQQHPKKRPPN